MPIILRKHRLTNVCNLFIWVVISHVSHPYSSIDLTLPLNILLLFFINTFLFFHNGYNSTTMQSAFLIDLHMRRSYVNISTEQSATLCPYDHPGIPIWNLLHVLAYQSMPNILSVKRWIIKFCQHSHPTALWTYTPISTSDDRLPTRLTWATLMAAHCPRVTSETIYSMGNRRRTFVVLEHVLKQRI